MTKKPKMAVSALSGRYIVYTFFLHFVSVFLNLCMLDKMDMCIESQLPKQTKKEEKKNNRSIYL